MYGSIFGYQTLSPILLVWAFSGLAPVNAPVSELLLMAANPLTVANTKPASVSWKECLRQQPAWFGSQETIRIADNVLLYQRDTGGWPKNIDMAVELDDEAKTNVSRQKTLKNDSTIDKKYHLAEIEIERRTGYAWYVTAPRELLAKDYPGWLAMNSRLLGTAKDAAR
jgi:hypothetical protein